MRARKETETSPGGENSESEAPASTTGKKKSKSKGKKGGKSQDSLPVKPAVDPTPVKTIRIFGVCYSSVPVPFEGH